jgi:hypothetical protein
LGVVPRGAGRHAAWQPADDEGWRRAQEELAAAQALLDRFEDDPPVFRYVVTGAFRR